jgi:hypothetical protein
MKPFCFWTLRVGPLLLLALCLSMAATAQLVLYEP